MKNLIRKIVIWLFFVPQSILAQFAPGAGNVGTTAIGKDSSIFVAWATGCTVQRGYINIEDTTQTYSQGGITSNKAFFGLAGNATGYPENNMDVLSLGDGGSAILSFQKPIANKEGSDFAVFENGFSSSLPPFNDFLELAFVEVSTDGIRFVRFPSVSLTQDTAQIASFGQINPQKIHNLAGKYVSGYGTPFDLEELADSFGINIDSINFIRIVDVVGDVNLPFATHDAKQNIINDPWPTPFWTGGFDLNAVGVIHQYKHTQVINKNTVSEKLKIFPIPADNGLSITCQTKILQVDLFSSQGSHLLGYRPHNNALQINTRILSNGFYVLRIETSDGSMTKKIMIFHRWQ